MNYQTIQNHPLVINFKELLNDRSWVLNGNTATHYPCNVDSILRLIGYEILPNTNYTVSFKIIEMSDTPSLGVGFDTPLYTYTTAQDVILVLNTDEVGKQLTFWGNGYIVLEVINIQKEEEPVTTDSKNTVTWDESNNRWVSFRGYRPETGFSMFTDMFTYKNGNLWVHKESNVRNNFYGQQFQTKLKFPSGTNTVKTYQSLAIHSNIIMATTTDGITTQLGHVSDLIETDFSHREGIWYANFLRDKLTDIVNGDRLKGRYIVLELITVEGHKKLQLFKVVAKSVVSTPN